MSDTRESLIKEYANQLYLDMEESCAQGGIEFDPDAAMIDAMKEATAFVDRCAHLFSGSGNMRR